MFVETGTFWGDMVNAQRKNFSSIYSIELGADLWKNAVNRFKSYKQIEIIQGDSGRMLRTVMQKLNEPAIFWLDSHYSGGLTARGDKDCPIYEEIDSIFAGKKQDHIILVDDSRCFIGEDSYPTQEALTKYIQSKDPRYTLKITDDVMQFVIDK